MSRLPKAKAEVYADIWEMLCRSYARNNRRRAIAAGTRSAETRSKAPSEGCQSGAERASPNRNSNSEPANG